jgi:hypothetical protein
MQLIPNFVFKRNQPSPGYFSRVGHAMLGQEQLNRPGMRLRAGKGQAQFLLSFVPRLMPGVHAGFSASQLHKE